MIDSVSIHTHTGKFIQLFKTSPNPHGICSISYKKKNILAFPDEDKGSVQVVDLDSMECVNYECHEHEIESIALNIEGNMMATASSKGTLIRVVELTNGNLEREFRRGSKQCTIYSIAFSVNSRFIACTGSSGTVHTFDLEKDSLVTDMLDALNISFSKSESKYHGIEGKTVVAFKKEYDYPFSLVVFSSTGHIFTLGCLKKTIVLEDKIAFME